jgi:hypothetical protein
MLHLPYLNTGGSLRPRVRYRTGHVGSQAPGSAPIWAMTSGYSSDIRAVKPLVFVCGYQAFVDDSTSEVGDRRLFLAGFINTADRWIRFSDAWKEELNRPRKIEYLKMREAHSLRDQFRNWTPEARDEKLKGLARLIRHFRPASFHASVSTADFERIVAPYAPYGLNPYTVCFQYLIVPVANQQAQIGGPKVPIDFVFDNQEGLGESARFIYKLVRTAQPNAVQKYLSVEPLFRDDKEVLPLQAADMLAWHIRRRWEDLGPYAYQIPDSLDATGFHMALDIGTDHLQWMAEGFKKKLGSTHVPSRSAWKKTRREIENRMEAGALPPFRWVKFKNTLVHLRIRLGLKLRTISGLWRRFF